MRLGVGRGECGRTRTFPVRCSFSNERDGSRDVGIIMVVANIRVLARQLLLTRETLARIICTSHRLYGGGWALAVLRISNDNDMHRATRCCDSYDYVLHYLCLYILSHSGSVPSS
jgi:hypothetical protein